MRGAFLDLNGTLVEPVKVEHPSEYALLPCAAASYVATDLLEAARWIVARGV